MQAAVENEIQEMVRAIVRGFSPEKVILFGSWARGTAARDSDVDLLVVMRFQGSRRETRRKIDLALSSRTLPLDIVVVTPEEMERDREQVGTIVRPAVREGRVLYERAA